MVFSVDKEMWKRLWLCHGAKLAKAVRNGKEEWIFLGLQREKQSCFWVGGVKSRSFSIHLHPDRMRMAQMRSVHPAKAGNLTENLYPYFLIL